MANIPRLQDRLPPPADQAYYTGGDKFKLPDLVQPFIGSLNDLTCANCFEKGHGVAQCGNTRDFVWGCPYHNELHSLADCKAPLARTRESITYWYWTVRAGLPPIYENSITPVMYSDNTTRGPLQLCRPVEGLGMWKKYYEAVAPRDTAFGTSLAKPLPGFLKEIMPNWLVDGKTWAKESKETMHQLGDSQIELLREWYDTEYRAIRGILYSQDEVTRVWNNHKERPRLSESGPSPLEVLGMKAPQASGKTSLKAFIEISDDESDASSDEDWKSETSSEGSSDGSSEMSSE